MDRWVTLSRNGGRGGWARLSVRECPHNGRMTHLFLHVGLTSEGIGGRERKDSGRDRWQATEGDLRLDFGDDDAPHPSCPAPSLRSGRYRRRPTPDNTSPLA